MLGNVERYVLTPVVLRFARKYIKNVEGAAATDLQVSLTGGSLIFRNFELNLEEVVKNLPCSVVRAFARELQIRIPWTRLASEAIEVTLDTVECVFSKDRGENSPPEKQNGPQEASKGEDADPVDPGAPSQTWVGSLLQSAFANVTVRVKNSVIKYITDRAVATISVQSMVAFSADQDWRQAFIDPLLGLRRACSFSNVSVCLDELDSLGRVAAYSEALIRTPSVDVRLSLSRKHGSSRCEAQMVVGQLDSSVSPSQLEQLQAILQDFQKSGSSDTDDASIREALDGEGSLDGSVNKEVAGAELEDSSSKEEESDDTSSTKELPDSSGEGLQKSSALVQAAAAGWRPIGWAWNFLANEDAAAGSKEIQKEAIHEIEEEADLLGMLGSGGPLDLVLRLELRGGNVKLRHVASAERKKESSDGSEEDDGVEVVDKAVVEQTLSPPAGVFIPTPGLFSSLPEVRSPRLHTSNSEGGFAFAALQWKLLVLEAHVAEERLRSAEAQLEWARLCKIPTEGGKPTDVLLSLMPPKKKGRKSFEYELSSHPGLLASSSGASHTKESDQKAVRIIWKQEESSDLESQQASSLQVTMGHLAAAYRPGLVAPLTAFLIRKSRKAADIESVPSQNGRDVEAELRSEGHASSLERESDVIGATLERPLKDVRPLEQLLALSAFEFKVDSCRLSVLSADAETEPSAITVISGALVCRQERGALVGVNSKESKEGLAVELRDIQAHVSSEWTMLQEGTLVFKPVTFRSRLCPSNQGLQIATTSSDFCFRAGGPEVRVIADVANAALQDLLGSERNFGVPPVDIFKGTWLALIWTGASYETNEGGKSAQDVRFRTLEAEVLGSRMAFLPSTVDQDSLTTTVTYGPQEDRHCTIVVDEIDAAFSPASLHVLHTFHSLNETPKSNETVNSSLQESPPSSTPAHSLSFLGSANIKLVKGRFALKNEASTVVPVFEFTAVAAAAKKSALEKEVGSQDRVETIEASLRLDVAEAKLQLLSEGAALDVGDALLRLESLEVGSKQRNAFQGSSVLTTTKSIDIKVGRLSGGVSRQQHVGLLLLSKNLFFSHVAPEAASQSAAVTCPEGRASEPVNQAEAATCSSEASLRMEIGGADLKLGLWKDEKDVDLLEKDCITSSVLSILGSRFVIEDSKSVTIREKDPQKIISRQLTSATTNLDPGERATSQRALTLTADDLSVNVQRFPDTDSRELTYPILEVRRVEKEKLPVQIRWLSRGSQPGKLEIDLAELDWRLDAQLIQEFVTLAFEPRKHFPNPGGPDVFPTIPTVRIVASSSRCYILSSLEAFLADTSVEGIPTQESGVLLACESSVILLNPAIDADVRQWAGVHDSSKPQTPSMEARVQEVDLSLLGFQLSLLETPKTPNPFILLSDTRVSCTFVGCPFPLSLKLDTRQLEVAASLQRLSVLQGLFASLLAAWSATWPLRQKCGGPVLPSDDLRSGLFKRALGETSDMPGPGEVSWGEDWIVWTYPYPRRVALVLIDLASLPGETGPHDFVLSFRAEGHSEKGTWTEGSLATSSEGQLQLTSEVCASVWRLTWHSKIDSPHTLPRNEESTPQFHRPFEAGTPRAVDLLPRLQINPSSVLGVSTLPVLAPLLFEVSVDSLEVELLSRTEEECGRVRVEDLRLGYHWWASTAMTVALVGMWSGEYVDTASQTYERLVDPVECALVVDIRSLLAPDRSLLPQYDAPPPPVAASQLLHGLSAGHPRTPPPSLGYSFDIQTRGDVCVRLQESLLEEAKRRNGKKEGRSEVVCEADTEKQGRLLEQKRNSSEQVGQNEAESMPAILLRNETPVAIQIGQLNTDEALLILPGGAVPYTWKHPPSLVPGAKKELRVRCAKLENESSDVQKCAAASSWSDGFSLQPSDGFVRSVRIGSKGTVSLILKVREESAGSLEVSVAGGLRFVNRTAGVLAIKYRGWMLDDKQADFQNEVELSPPPKKALRDEPQDVGSAQPTDVHSPSNKNGAGHWHRGQRILTIPSGGAACDVLLVDPPARDVSNDVSDDEDRQLAAVSVLLEPEEVQSEAATWSPWLSLDGESCVHLLTVDTKSTPVRGVQRGLPCVWCQVAATAGEPLLVSLWPLFMAYNGLHRAVEVRVGEEGFESVKRTVKEREQLPIVASTSGVDSVAFRFATRDSASKEKSASCLEVGSNSEARADVLDALGGVWSAPLLLTTEAPDLQTRKLASIPLGYASHIPPVGQLCQVVLNGSGQEEKELNCVLAAEPLSSEVPTTVLSLLPYAVLHNATHHLVSIGASMTRGTITAVATAEPGCHVAFSWPSVSARRVPRAKIGLSFSDEIETTIAGGGRKRGEREGEEKIVWSSSVSLEEGGIHEGSVWVPAGECIAECCFLVRIEHVSHKSTTPSHVTCHVSIYPWALASNLSPYSLHLLPFQASYPGATSSQWPAHNLPAGQSESHVLVRRLVKEPPPDLTPGLSSITYPSLSDAPLARLGMVLEPGRCSLWSQGPIEIDSHSSKERNVTADPCIICLGLAPSPKDQLLSPPFNIDEPATQRRKVLRSADSGHDVMLTYSVLSADGQAHVVVHEEVQPPAIIRNESDVVLSVRKFTEEDEGRENFVLSIAPRSVLHFDLEGFGGLGEGADVEEAMDEALLLAMKGGARDVQLQIRTANGGWSEPFWTGVAGSFEYSFEREHDSGAIKAESADESRKESDASSWAKVSVCVEKQGASCCILVTPSARPPDLEANTPTGLPSNLAFNLALETLRIAVFDNDACLLRGGVPAGEPPPQSDMAPAFLLTLDRLSLKASRVSAQCPVGLPAVTSSSCQLSFAAVQLDNHLPGTKLPVILAVDLGEVGLGAATLRGHPSSKNNPFPAASFSLTFCQPILVPPSSPLSISWLQELDVRTQPLILNIDDSLLGLATRIRQPQRVAEPSSETFLHPDSQGLLVRSADLALANPQLYVHSLTISDVRLALTVCVSRTVILDVRAAPVRLSELEIRTVLFPSAVLARGVLGHYVTEAICNVHRVVGSLELLFNPTGLVKSVRAGLRDLVQLPIVGSRSGPFGFLWGLGAGGASLSLHVSRWGLSSVAGFSSSLSRILERTYTAEGSLNSLNLAPQQAGGGSSSPQKAKGVRRGLVGALMAPVSGALQLVANTSSGLLGQSTGPQPRLKRTSSSMSVEGEVESTAVKEEVFALEGESASRCTEARVREHLPPGETYLQHMRAESLTVVSASGEGSDDVRPKSVEQGSLLLSDKAVYVLEYGGIILVARLSAKGLHLEEDHTSCELVLVADRTVDVADAQSASFQVFARFDVNTWKQGSRNLKVLIVEQ